MGEMLLILKLSLTLLLSYINVSALVVLVAKKPINYEEKLDLSFLKMKSVAILKKTCKPLSLAQVKKNEYITSHYINTGSIICTKDVKAYIDNSVLFNFGTFQIEKKGKIVYENDDFIRIKKNNGKIEKIYKDGRLK